MDDSTEYAKFFWTTHSRVRYQKYLTTHFSRCSRVLVDKMRVGTNYARDVATCDRGNVYRLETRNAIFYWVRWKRYPSNENYRLDGKNEVKKETKNLL